MTDEKLMTEDEEIEKIREQWAATSKRLSDIRGDGIKHPMDVLLTALTNNRAIRKTYWNMLVDACFRIDELERELAQLHNTRRILHTPHLKRR